MQGIAVTVFGWMTVLIAAIAWMGGAGAAGDFAANSMHTIGVTIGSIVHGIPDAIDGFKATDTTGGNKKTNTPNGPRR